MRVLPMAFAAAAPALVLAGDLVGPETCKACHPAAYESWRDGPHARASEALPPRHRRDPRCVSCHAPDEAKGISGVSCETCHGPGQLYAVSYVMRDAEQARAVGLEDPNERTCAVCHTESTPSLTRFEYARKLPLIRHWEGEGRENRRK